MKSKIFMVLMFFLFNSTILMAKNTSATMVMPESTSDAMAMPESASDANDNLVRMQVYNISTKDLKLSIMGMGFVNFDDNGFVERNIPKNALVQAKLNNTLVPLPFGRAMTVMQTPDDAFIIIYKDCEDDEERVTGELFQLVDE